MYNKPHARKRARSSRPMKRRIISIPAASDAAYFAANPGHRFRLFFRLNRATKFFTFEFTTRDGAKIAGDVYDLRICLSRFTGTPLARLLKAIRWIALHYPHRIVEAAPDLVCSHHAAPAGFGKWVAAH